MKPVFDPILGKLRKQDEGGGQFNPNGIYPGLTAGGLIARESDAIVDLRTSFIFRSAGGNESISSGAAKITQICGNVVNGIPFIPASFKAVGFNAFNTANVLDKMITEEGNIIDSDEHEMAYVHVLAGVAASGRNNGYIISSKYNDSLIVNRVAFTTDDPTTAESATVLSATQIDSTRTSYLPPTDGWLLIDCYNAQLAEMCVHLAWSYNPANWEEYKESVIELPTVHEWGMGKAGNVYDEINFLNQQIITRVNRALMSELNWTEHKTDGSTVYSNAEKTEAIGSVEALGDDSIALQGNIYTRDSEHDTASAYAWTYDGTTVYTATDSPAADSYTYTTESIKDDIKASTTNISAYGLADGFTLAVDAYGTVTLVTDSHPINPAADLADIYAYYEIASEIIQPEKMDPIYEVHDFGTEEFIGTQVAPTYATFFYLSNLYDSLRQVINEDKNMRSYSVPFGTTSVMAQDINVEATITITKIVTTNVATLRITTGSYIQTLIPLTDGIAICAIPIGIDAIITWEITRINNNQNACIGVRYEY